MGVLDLRIKRTFSTGRKRSCGKVVYFTHVCLSVLGGGGGCMMSVPVWSHALSSRGVYGITSCVAPCSFWGGVWCQGIWSQRGTVYPTAQALTSSGGHQSGQYASYWNAFSRL